MEQRQGNGGLVVALAGASASGKSSLARAIASAMSCSLVGFGDHVRNVAHILELEGTREQLQAIGEDLVRQDPVGFCQAVLHQAEWKPGESLVVDGVRHDRILETLRDLVRPSDLRLVYLNVEDSTITERLSARGITDPHERARFDGHSTEREVRTILRERAELVLDGKRPVADLVEIVIGKRTIC